MVSFGQCRGFGEVSTGMMVSIAISLHEYSFGSEEGGVGHDSEGTGDVGD